MSVAQSNGETDTSPARLDAADADSTVSTQGTTDPLTSRGVVHAPDSAPSAPAPAARTGAGGFDSADSGNRTGLSARDFGNTGAVSDDNEGHGTSLRDRLVGRVETLAGRVLGNARLVDQGEDRRSGENHHGGNAYS